MQGDANGPTEGPLADEVALIQCGGLRRTRASPAGSENHRGCRSLRHCRRLAYISSVHDGQDTGLSTYCTSSYVRVQAVLSTQPSSKHYREHR